MHADCGLVIIFYFYKKKIYGEVFFLCRCNYIEGSTMLAQRGPVVGGTIKVVLDFLPIHRAPCCHISGVHAACTCACVVHVLWQANSA